MTVAQLIEFLKTVPQDYEIAQETLDVRFSERAFDVDHEHKVLWIPGT